MSERKMKRAGESYTTQVHLLTHEDLNGAGRLFGGRLMEWMDVVAAVTARRHGEHNVTTVKATELVFSAPAYAGEVLQITGKMVAVGRTSMTVHVDVFVESLEGEHRRICQADFVEVALDDQEHPTPVPGLMDEEEKTL